MSATVLSNKNLSTPRAKKFRENMVKDGFKRVQKWVFDLENITIQKRIKRDLDNLKQTKDMKEWDKFSLKQLDKIAGWDY